MRFNKSVGGGRPSNVSTYRTLLRLEVLEGRTLPSTLAVGPNVDISKHTGNEAESTISINPTNPLNLFAGSTAGNVNKYSTDGGQTWQNSTYVGLPGTTGDIQSAWDNFGNLFITYLSSSSIGTIVARSNDGGATFRDGRTIAASSTDQPSIAVGPSGVDGVPGAVWVTFTGSNGLINVAGAPVLGFDSVGAFSAARTVPNPSNGGDFGDIAIGPNGEVLVDYQTAGSGPGPDTIKVNLDPVGLNSTSFQAYSIATSTNVGGFSPIPAQPNRTVDAEANLAWDRSGGPFNGRVYMVYTDRATTSTADTDIYVRYSDDDGATWSDRVRVNDDAVGNGKSQFNPAIAVDQTSGNVAVTWYDTRDSGSANDTAEVWGTISEDGGNTFDPNVQISQGMSNAVTADAGFEFGDYDKMDFNNGVFYRTWADDSNSAGGNPDGRLDIYTAAVTVVPSTGTVTGLTWNDRNADGIQEPREPGLPGFTIFVDLHGDGVLEPDDPQAVSASDGTYTITGVPFGGWNVYEVLPDNWIQTYPAGGAFPVSLDVNNPIAADVNFGAKANWTPPVVVGGIGSVAGGVAQGSSPSILVVSFPPTGANETAGWHREVLEETGLSRGDHSPVSPAATPASVPGLVTVAPGAMDVGLEWFADQLALEVIHP